jgi:hypothetical protein
LALKEDKVPQDPKGIPVGRRDHRGRRARSVLRDPSETVVNKATPAPKDPKDLWGRLALRDPSENAANKATLALKVLKDPSDLRDRPGRRVPADRAATQALRESWDPRGPQVRKGPRVCPVRGDSRVRRVSRGLMAHKGREDQQG